MEERIPTEKHAALVKAARRLQNLEHLWRKRQGPEVAWCQRTRAIWAKVISNSETNGMEESVVRDWTEEQLKKDRAVWKVKGGKSRTERKGEEG